MIAAVRVVASDDTIIYPTAEVIDALRLKHPSTLSDFRPLPLLFYHPPTTNPNEVIATLRSFSSSSSARLDGLRPGHLKDLTSSITFEAGRKLLYSISNRCNILLSGNLPIYARELIFAANLTALRKKDGGVCPIVVGYVFRRLASKIIPRRVVNDLSNELRPIQLGVGVRNGCEGAVHFIRDYISANQNNTFSKSILSKLDMKNALYAVRCDHLLEVCHHRGPSVYNLASLTYQQQSKLFCMNQIISSASGVQQSDPIGPLLFALAVDDIALLNIWYLDDAILEGPVDKIIHGLRTIILALSMIGLEINAFKSEVVNLNLDVVDFQKALEKIQGILKEVQVTIPEKLIMLGAPIFSSAVKDSLSAKHS